jgi:Zn-dependent protease
MLPGHVRLGRIFGIEIGLHFSWCVIAALLTMSLAGHLYSVNPAWSPALIWTAAGLTALAFFAAIVLHELSHAAVARARGVPVASITLFALGGIAQMKRDTADAATEFWMGLAGPFASVVIGVAVLALAGALGWNFNATPDTPGMVMLVWFGFINITLAAFNMIPGFPLDGGRILRAILWWRSGNQVRATRVAAVLGQIVAVGFIMIGFLSFAFAGNFGGIWLAFIGLFLIDAARSAVLETTVMQGLRGVRVGDVMSRDCVTVARETFVSDVADQVLRTGKRCFFVADHGRGSHEASRTPPSDRCRRAGHQGPRRNRPGGRESAASARAGSNTRRHLAGSDPAASRGTCRVEHVNSKEGVNGVHRDESGIRRRAARAQGVHL